MKGKKMEKNAFIGVPCPYCNYLIPPGKPDTISMITLERASLVQCPDHYHGDHFISFLNRLGLDLAAIKYLRNSIFLRPPTVQEVMHYALTVAFMEDRESPTKTKKEIAKISNRIKRINLIADKRLGFTLSHNKSEMWATYLQSPRGTNEDRKTHSFIPNIPCDPLRGKYIFSAR